MKLFDLTGKVAIVTGSSRGIGRAIAEAMADHGAKVVISSRKAEACAGGRPTRSTPSMATARAIVVPANISSKEALQDLVDETRRQLGRIDMLVCNAASNPYYGPMAGISDEQFRKILDNNVIANHWLIQMVAPEMLERKRRLDHHRQLDRRPQGLDRDRRLQHLQGGRLPARAQPRRRVRAAPGARQLHRAGPDPAPISPGRSWENPETLKAVTMHTPLQRIGEPHEIAGAAVFLASPASTFMTGQAIVVDGGATTGVGL